VCSSESPTDLLDDSLLHTGHDSSEPENGRYYKDHFDMPWILNLPGDFAHPLENARVDSAYTHFRSWAGSNGREHADWYLDRSGYRQNQMLYHFAE